MIRQADFVARPSAPASDVVLVRPCAPVQARYWSPHWLAVTCEGPDGRIEEVIQKPFARLGSHADCEFPLAADRVAGRSLYLHATDAGVFGVVLPRVGRRAARWLKPSDVIEFGPYRVSARLVGVANNGHETPWLDLGAKGMIPPPHPLVTVSLGGEEVAACRLSRRLTILGSHPSSNIQFKSAHVSECQLALYWSSGSLWAVDLLGPHRTTCQGRLIDAVCLDENQLLSFGQIDLAYSPARDDPGGPLVQGPSMAAPIDWNSAREENAGPVAPARPTREEPTHEEEQASEEQAQPSLPAAHGREPSSPTPVMTTEDPDALFHRVTDRLIASHAGAAAGRWKRRWLLTLLSVALAGAGVMLALGHAGRLARWWMEMP